MKALPFDAVSIAYTASIFPSSSWLGQQNDERLLFQSVAADLHLHVLQHVIATNWKRAQPTKSKMQSWEQRSRQNSLSVSKNLRLVLCVSLATLIWSKRVSRLRMRSPGIGKVNDSASPAFICLLTTICWQWCCSAFSSCSCFSLRKMISCNS